MLSEQGVGISEKAPCSEFLTCMIQAVDKLKGEDSESDIRMLISGGRKGMSALSFLAAQRSLITKVYHTLIADPQLEKQIQNECTIDRLSVLGIQEKAERMFLERYPKERFELLDIPVITFQAVPEGS